MLLGICHLLLTNFLCVIRSDVMWSVSMVDNCCTWMFWNDVIYHGERLRFLGVREYSGLVPECSFMYLEMVNVPWLISLTRD